MSDDRLPRIQDISIADLYDRLGASVAPVIAAEANDRSRGHCMRIGDLPERVAVALTPRLRVETDAEVYVLNAAADGLGITPTKLVERRNAGVKVLVFIPPGTRAAAEDSFGASTFEDIPLAASVRNLREEARADAMAAAGAARELFEATAGHLATVQKDVDDVAFARYYLALLESGITPATIGVALYLVGLIPDLGLASSRDNLLARLHRNRALVDLFSRADRTPIEKLQTARLNPRSDDTPVFRKTAFSFFSTQESSDRFAWTRRIALDPSWLDRLAYDRWPLVDNIGGEHLDVIVHAFAKLPHEEDGYPHLKLSETSELTVSWETWPAPTHCPTLARFTVELLQDETPVTEEKTVKRGTSASTKRSVKFKHLHDHGLEDGLHIVRVTAWSEDGDLLAHGDSPPVFVEADGDPPPDPEPTRVELATSLAHVDLLRRFRARDADRQFESEVEPTRSWSFAGERVSDNRVDTYTLRFPREKVAYGIPVNAMLHDLEEQILAEPDALGLYRLDVLEIHQSGELPFKLQDVEHLDYDRLEVFLAARRRLFDAILNAGEGKPGRPVVATVDLGGLGDLILGYATAYRTALVTLAIESDDPVAATWANAQLLAIDTVEVRTRGSGRVVLMAPTHPLKLLWAYQQYRVFDAWARDLDRLDSDEIGLTTLRSTVNALSSLNLPPFVVGPAGAALVNLEQIDALWSLFVAPDVTDPRALISEVRATLGARGGDVALTTVGSDQVAAKLRQYLDQHPYARALVINAVQPGSGVLLVDTMLALHDLIGSRDGGDLRFRIRLIAEDADHDDLGSALDDLMDQDAVAISQAAEKVDAFLTASANPLFPKLSFSRHPIDDLRSNPEQFDAHVTLLLDYFASTVDVAAPDPRSAGAYIFGLLHEPSVWYTERDGHAIWRHALGARPPFDLADGNGAAGEMSRTLRAHLAASARLLGGDGTPVVCLDLDPVRASVLNRVHQISDWVITIDRHFGVEYLDAPNAAGGSAYLIDFAPEGAIAAGHRMITSTTRVNELWSLVRPALAALDLPAGDAEVDLVLSALKSLSGRLVLQLLTAWTRTEVLGLAIARLFLRQSGLLHDGFIVPLDAHRKLFTAAASEGTGTNLRRTDLILVQPEPTERALMMHLVEVKVRSTLSGDFATSPLRDSIDEQLANTERVLSEQFGAQAPGQERVDRLLKTKQLATLLRFYLDRAGRYGLMTETLAGEARRFLDSLEEGYRISFTRHAVVIDRSREDYEVLELDGATYHLLGREIVTKLVREPAEREPRPIDTPTTAGLAPTRARFDRVAGRRTMQAVPAVGVEGEGDAPPASEPEQELETARAEADDSVGAQPTSQPEPATSVGYDVLLGNAHHSPQYGLLGRHGNKTVALDLNGTQTICLFGVQGSGKSYTLGSILEMATAPMPGINRLRQPLASVLFHYSSDQTYPPEFASMIEPNTATNEVERLVREYGARPVGLDDVVILTPEAKVEERRNEFPGIDVQPILFHPTELSVEDWFFLMGAVGNESIYLKKMRQVFRKLRNDLTINALYSGVANLSGQPLDLAKTRLDFAKEFIREDHRLGDYLRPGRLLIVDVRDPFYERAEVLALFVVMVRVLAQVEQAGPTTNKLFVFDEAHQYMNEKDLVGEVVDAIRKMRHKGVSILVAAGRGDRALDTNRVAPVQFSRMAQTCAESPNGAGVAQPGATEPVAPRRGVRLVEPGNRRPLYTAGGQGATQATRHPTWRGNPAGRRVNQVRMRGRGR